MYFYYSLLYVDKWFPYRFLGQLLGFETGQPIVTSLMSSSYGGIKLDFDEGFAFSELVLHVSKKWGNNGTSFILL